MKLKTMMMATLMVAMMLGVTVIPLTEGSDATSGDLGTYTYTIEYDPTLMSTTSAAISISDMTPISHANTGVFEGMNAGSWTWNATTGIGPFNSFYAAFDINNGNAFVSVLNPYDLSKKIDGTTLGTGYNIMWVLPTVYWKVTNGNLTLTNDSTAGGTAYAHTIDGHVYNYIAIGVYEATSDDNSNPTKLTSEIGKLPLVSKTRAQFRSLADAYTMNSSLGANAYSMQWNFYQWELYKYCSLAVMENFNSQNTVGNGHAFGSTYAFQTGSTNTMGPYAGNNGLITDNTTGTSYGSDPVKLFIENAWAGVNEFVDGAVFVGNTGVYIDTSSVPTDSTTAGTDVTWNALTMPTSSGFPTEISTTATTWGWGTGSAYGGAATTGLCDKTYSASSSTGDKVLFVGGNSSPNAPNTANYGLSCANASNDTSHLTPYIGSRLAFVFDDATVKIDISSNNNSYGTVDVETIDDAELFTSMTVSDNVIILDGTTVTATKTTDDAQYTYAFDGWYVGTSKLKTGDPITHNMTILAMFSRTVNSYTITWDIDGVTTTETYDYGQTPTHADPTKEGYVFNGWSPSILPVSQDQTYTATWLPLYTSTLILDANGGEDAPEPLTYTGTATTDHVFTIPETSVSKNGFKLSGWAETEDATEQTYVTGDEVSVAYNGTLTLYAVWVESGDDIVDKIMDLVPILVAIGIILGCIGLFFNFNSNGVSMTSVSPSTLAAAIVGVAVAILIFGVILLPIIQGM